MTDQQLCKGIALARAGKRQEARCILGQVVRDNPRSVQGWLWLAGVVELKAQRRYCLEKALQLNPQNEMIRRALTRIGPQTVDEMGVAEPSVAQSPQRTEDLEGFRRVIAAVFGPLGHEPYYTGKSVDKDVDVEEGQPLLLTICQEIFSASFGVFNLSSEDPNSYLELGIALGLNRPIIAVARETAVLPPALEGHRVIRYAAYSDLERRLSRACDERFPPTARPVADYCHFCGHVCESMSTPPDENAYLVLHSSRLLWRNLMRSLAPHLAGYHLYPVYLAGGTSGATLCDMRRQVLASQFALCHLGELSDESSFLALGMAIGSRVPWILLSREGQAPVPSDLQDVDRIEYATPDDLEEALTDALGLFLGRVMSSPAVRHDKTTLLSLPLWVQLEDWIDRSTQPAQALEAIQGGIRVAGYERQKCVSRHTVPRQGLLFGRSTDCDVVVENPSVSSRHFRILKGRTGRCFVEDLHSRNGTFLNGARLPPGKRVELGLNDTIRIPGARFLIWDDRPLPREDAAQTFGDTSLLPPILKLEIPDVAPPTYLSTWDHSLVLTVVLPDGHHRAMFEVQAYYPMGRILSELADLLDLPGEKYRFRSGNKLIDDNETPLSIGIQRGDVLSLAPEES
jgi:hypothetical protein